MKNVEKIKKDFPIFKMQPDLVYLDSTATSFKPQSVIDSLVEYYSQYSANIFRGIYDISEKATAAYEETRTIIKDFIGANSEMEIVFTRNTTESINLFVNGIKDSLIPSDEIVTTIAEHHSNFVPWQQLAKKRGLKFIVMRNVKIGVEDIRTHITQKTKILAITHASNVLGTVNPVKDIIREAKKINPHIIVLVDGAQVVPHMKVNMHDLGCDAFTFSGHKMLGPTGVGVLWVKKELLKTFAPYQYGGEMIRKVTVEETEFADIPHRFEAGTPHIAGVIALKEAVRYLEKIGLNNIHQHEVELAQLCYNKLKDEFGEKISIIGPQVRESGIVAFVLKGVHAHDVAQLLNEDNIAVRAGHHCAMPLHIHLGIEASIRASFYLYNTKKDIQKLIMSLHKAFRVFK
ncbi:MAG: cysteine desulfurase [bacterium]